MIPAWVITAVAVFFAVAVGDVVWTLWANAIAEKKKWVAALTSGLIISIGSFTTVNYVNDHRLIPAAVLGAIVGTLTVMTWRERQDARKRIQLPADEPQAVSRVGIGSARVGEGIQTGVGRTVETTGSQSPKEG